MSENSKIEWTDHTFNPWIGCTKVSPGCAHCYAESEDKRRGWTEGGWGKGKPRKRTSIANWNKVRQWNAFPIGRVRPRVFCASLADVFDDEVPIEWLADLLALIHECQNLDFQLLTKRPENWERRISAAAMSIPGTDDRYDGMIGMVSGWVLGTPPANVWIGTSAEDQERWDERVPQLLKIPARIRFVSAEPLLGPINMRLVEMLQDACDGSPMLHWIIFGGESGPRARAFNVDWLPPMLHDCAEAGVAALVKQLGSRPIFTNPGEPAGASAVVLRDRKGGDWNEWREDLRVRQFPETRE